MPSKNEVTVVNFSHPLTKRQCDQIGTLMAGSVVRVIDVPARFNNTAPFASQVEALLEVVDLSHDRWKSREVLVNLPNFAPIGALLLVHLHSLIGHFPAIIRLSPEEDGLERRFAIAEILNLQCVCNSDD